jgi:hypothetical protein
MTADIGFEPLNGVDPLPEERIVGGIHIPKMDEEKAFPFIQLQTDIPGLVYNVTGPELDDLVAAAELIHKLQARPLFAPVPALVWLRDPFMGHDCAITPAGLRHITSVARSTATKVDPVAAARGRNGRTLHLPPRG